MTDKIRSKWFVNISLPPFLNFAKEILGPGDKFNLTLDLNKKIYFEICKNIQTAEKITR